MKCIRILIVLMAIMFGQGVAFAQEEQTTKTHAEATSQKWKGIDVNEEVIGNSAYTDDNTLESGYPFLLYNVGPGRFIMQGGDWAMEGRLFFSDFGLIMNIVLGLLGGALGGWLFSLLGISWGGILGQLATAIIGAVIILWIASFFKK